MTKPDPLSDEEKNDPEEVFAWTFHSFKNLHNVSPNQFMARLRRNGVVLSMKVKKSRAAVGDAPGPAPKLPPSQREAP